MNNTNQITSTNIGIIRIISSNNIKIFKTPDYAYDRLMDSSDVLLPRTVTILIISTSWYMGFDKLPQIMQDFSFNKAKYSSLIILTDTEEEYEEIKKQFPTVDVIFSSNNAFVNENTYHIKNNNRQYDLIINSRFGAYKRVDLAKLCNNVAIVGYHMDNNQSVFYPFAKYLNFKNRNHRNYFMRRGNYKYFSQQEIMDALNNSLVGGIFSKVEGACKASAEYLLCGLPIISTKSLGGRDLWYDENNSIICDDNPQVVKEALNLALKKLKDGSFNREIIRQNHISITKQHRKRFIEFIKNKLNSFNSNSLQDSDLCDYVSEIMPDEDKFISQMLY